MANPPHDSTQDAPTTDAGARVVDSLGGTSGMIRTAIPVIVFVVANAVWTLPVAIGAAVLVALGLTVHRVRGGESIAGASGGLVGVLAAGAVAAMSGSANGYFLLGIWTSLVAGVVVLASVLIRRPVTGLLWNALHGNRYAWRRNSSVRRAHDVATLTFAVLFGARYLVQDWLYDTDATGWLAVARIGMGAPLFAVAVVVTVWAFRRSTTHFVR
ncbi:DUF3159 domain-containing protein [Rhodococcus sp. SORGH_AS_0303]|uniref:DUF3159 domain-containing protein n=1 Tax=Rhodococcus sp. SORGH_AS_0303 TaxID=3041753 RepID=UPI002786C555|nr:DUF3159 domain-containing protein [Rhodococcus sp. SORGH_AS_0303]MDQ1203537.1 hypothetical protein [Rhodococcus sp. SORGH_AS_0303]